ncbi:MAG: hypothetical protein V3V85_00530 [Candidatus Thorarchaeota archaeon]
MKLAEIEQTTAHLEQQGQELKEGLAKILLEQPDNPRITRLGSSVRCFTIKSSDLGDNWTPFYHDFKMQYDKLASIICKTALGTIPARLREIVETRSFRDPSERYTYHFHTDVILHIAELLGLKLDEKGKII